MRRKKEIMVKSNEPWQINKEIEREKKKKLCTHQLDAKWKRTEGKRDIEQEREQMGKFITMTENCTKSQYF